MSKLNYASFVKILETSIVSITDHKLANLLLGCIYMNTDIERRTGERYTWDSITNTEASNYKLQKANIANVLVNASTDANVIKKAPGYFKEYVLDYLDSDLQWNMFESMFGLIATADNIDGGTRTQLMRLSEHIKTPKQKATYLANVFLFAIKQKNKEDKKGSTHASEKDNNIQNNYGKYTDKSLIRPLTSNDSNRSQGGTYIKRDALLKEIEEKFDRVGNKNIVFLSGMGGTGKSELARAYAYENRRRYTDIFMFTYKENVGLLEQINNSRITYALSHEDLTKLDSDTLIIVDNYDENDENLLNELQYCTGNAHILITTRSRAIGNYNDIIPIDEDGQAAFAHDVFVKNYCRVMNFRSKRTIKEKEFVFVRRICNYLQNNAMFSALIAIRLRDYPDMTLEECANKIKLGIERISGDQNIIVINKDGEKLKAPLSNILQFLFSDILKREFDKREVEVLRLLCMFPAQIQNTEFIFRLLEGSYKSHTHDAAAERLLDSGIIQGDMSWLSIHPLIAELLNTAYGNSEPNQFFLDSEFYTRITENFLRLPWEMLLKHKNELNFILEHLPDDEKTSKIMLSAHLLLPDEKWKRTQKSYFSNICTAVFACGTYNGKRRFVYRDLAQTNENERDHILFECVTDETDTDLCILKVTDQTDSVILDLSESICEMIITSIPNGICHGNYSIKAIRFPKTLKSIGAFAFDGCRSLEGCLSIPQNVGTIGRHAFYGCPRLAGVDLSNSRLTVIEDFMFMGCDNLVDVKLPDSITLIDMYAFYGCKNLVSIKLPDSLKAIGSFAFYGCSGLTSIVLPEPLTTIGEFAFSDCSELVDLKDLSKNLNVIGDHAFGGCPISIDSINLNTSTSIGVGAFGPIGWLNLGNLPEPVYNEGGRLKIKGKLKLPIGVNRVIAFSCYRNDELTEINLPDTVTSIGKYAFYGCTGIKKISWSKCLKEIGDYAFLGCTQLTSIALPKSLTSIGEYAFEGCTKLSTITIPKSIRIITDNSFSGCPNVKVIFENRSIQIITNNTKRPCSETIICGHKYSTAEQYANDNGLSFEVI